MQQEKYSRQIKLFGNSTQKKIEESHIHIVDYTGKSEKHLIRLLQQLGANNCTDKQCSLVPTWIFVCDRAAEQAENVETSDLSVMYIDTQSLALSRQYTTEKHEKIANILQEYLNILVGVAVQEYIKDLAGLSTLASWKLDVSMFE